MYSSVFALFQPLSTTHLHHRVIMAPLTRLRANKDHIHAGYANVPGVWNGVKIGGWKKVLGRTADIAIIRQERGFDLVAPSPIPLDGVVPRELTTAEIKKYAQLYSKAASNAIEAGLDGLEVHAANGYILDQFLQMMSSERTGEYGGSVDNRVRFPLEVIDAVVEAIGAERTAPRVHGIVNGDKNWGDCAHIVAGSMDGAAATNMVEKYGGLVAFGRHFIANWSHFSDPDVPLRVREGHSLARYNSDTFYTTEAAAGYTDYPFTNNVGVLQA
ncbi:putative NADPH2 dehydrogenase chain OYE2 [Lactarius vividus]|nr:putative NADPH2 dehydrogenase chain OYE2 [Lactarius vividus]